MHLPKSVFRFSVITIALLVVISWTNVKKSTDPFSNLNYDKVIAYDYGDDHDDSEATIVNDSGKIVSTVVNKKILSKSQILNINKVLSDTNTYGKYWASCFEPHLGLVYYRHDSIVAHVSICLECNFLSSSFEIPAIEHYGFYVDTNWIPLRGFTPIGRKKINKLVKELNFTHSIILGCVFDEEEKEK